MTRLMSNTRLRIATFAGLLFLALLVGATAGWGTLAIGIKGPQDTTLRNALALAFACTGLAALIALPWQRWRWHALGAYLAVLVPLSVWWSGIEPANDRQWQADVAVLPYATVKGDLVTVHNIRNFDYRSETDYTPAWYDKRFDLSELQGVDMIAVYWMGPAIAHVFLSFDFGGDDRLAISIETRKEQGEGYSTLRGFFREYELYYVVADERDVIRLRTNYRREPPEQVYIYPLQGEVDNARRVFLEYIKRINALHERPAFYNTLTTNCTTTIWMNSRVNPNHLTFDWKILASGYLPEYLYEQGRLADQGLSFTELQQRVHVNARAQAADKAADFSRRIREQPAGANLGEHEASH